jgi:hypothetical protein
MMTAFEMKESEFKTVFPSTHVDRVIRKPFSPARIVEAINEIFITKGGTK